MGGLQVSLFIAYSGVFLCQSAMAACLLCLWMDRSSSVHARVRDYPLRSVAAGSLYAAICLMPTWPAIKILAGLD